jgi:orotate phosphoribosyltransferase
MDEAEKEFLGNREGPLITSQHENAGAVMRVLGKALGKSDYVARSGLFSHYYFNFDKVYGSKDVAKEDIQTVHKLVISRLQTLVNETGATHVGLIFPKQGPVGIVQLRAILAERLSVPTVIIHIDERLLRNQVGFDPQKPHFDSSAKVLLFCDAATSGASIYRASRIVKKIGAACVGAFTLFDRLQGAKEKLEIKNIRLSQFMDRKFFIDFGELGEELLREDKPAPRLGFESVSTVW